LSLEFSGRLGYHLGMVRIVRASIGGICYHVTNRGNGMGEAFYTAEVYYRCTEMMQQFCVRLPLRVAGWCP
jgi:REP element-mobilizing transposase RayT